MNYIVLGVNSLVFTSAFEVVVRFNLHYLKELKSFFLDGCSAINKMK